MWKAMNKKYHPMDITIDEGTHRRMWIAREIYESKPNCDTCIHWDGDEDGKCPHSVAVECEYEKANM